MTISRAKEIKFFVNDKAGGVSGLLLEPSGARAFFLLAHGAGAGMRHKFMEEVAAKLAELKLFKPLCSKLGKRAELFVVDGSDHSFHMLKSAPRSDGEVLNDVVKK